MTTKASLKRRAFLIAKLALAVLAIAVSVLFARTLVATSRQPAPLDLPRAPLDEAAIAEHLGAAIRVLTVSDPADKEPRWDQIQKLHALLEANYPTVHAKLTREIIARGSLLFTWKGSDATKKPILLLAHMDVVPVEPGTEAAWEEPPFSGAVKGGFVWGRGALDDKMNVIAILESVERLTREGFVPPRDVYLAFGHDEEVSGRGGAREIAALLKERGVRAAFALDEGNPITLGIVPGIAAPVAIIGLAEKGYATVDLEVQSGGGHSSMPPPETAIGVLAKAIARLEERPMAARLEGAMAGFVDYAAPEMSLGLRFVFVNRAVTGPLLLRALAAKPSTNASIRTTTAPTIFHAGVKDNVLPASARASVNFRILPGDTSQDVLRHVEREIGDARVTAALRKDTVTEPSPTSSAESAAFISIARAVRTVFGDAVVAPSLFLAATDSRHYAGVADDVYRFTAVKMASEDIGRVHGKNERISVASLADLARFYEVLLRSASD